jgi:hypothetical protein
MSERRIHKRYGVDPLNIVGSTLGADEIEIVDLGLGGVSLRANRRLNIGEIYTLLIKSKGKVLNLQGEVIWAKISEIRRGRGGNTIARYTAGLEFKDPSDNKRDEIITFMGSHKEGDKSIDFHQISGIRLYTRVRVNAPDEALIIGRTESLKVKKMSYSGALVESRNPIKVSSKMPMMITLAEDRFIVFKGEISSCLLIKSAHPRAYDIGIKFTEMSKADRSVLSEFIRLLNEIDKSPQE